MYLHSGTVNFPRTLPSRNSHCSRFLVMSLAVALLTMGSAHIVRAQSEKSGKSGKSGKATGAKPKSPKKDDVKKLPENPFPDRPKVPSGIFDGGKAWLNASGPISVKDLKGKIVIVDFWTYC